MRNSLQSVILIASVGSPVAVCTWVLWGAGGIPWALLALALAYAVAHGAVLYIGLHVVPVFSLRKWGARHVEWWPVVPVLTEMARRAGLPCPPKFYVVRRTGSMSAFAGGGRSHSVLAITNELLHRLDDRELIGVLAHEMAHISRNDLWIMNLANATGLLADAMMILGALLFLLSIPPALLGWYAVPWPASLLLFLTPIASDILRLGFSRAREYDADREGAQLSGDPEALISALQKMEDMDQIWESLYGSSLPGLSLLRTHPPIKHRIRCLEGLGQPSWPPICSPAPGAKNLVPRVTEFGGRGL